MGVFGVGFVVFVATWIGLGIMLFYAARERHRFTFIRWSNLSRKLTWNILKLSIPTAAATVAMMVNFGLFAQVAGKLDAMESVGAAAGQREAVNGAATTDIVALLKLTFTACIAFGTATATLVAQALAAKRPADADRFGWASVRLGLVRAGPRLPRQGFGSGAGIGRQRVGIGGTSTGPRPDSGQIEVRFGRLRRGASQSSKAGKRCDDKKMRKFVHSAQQFRLRQTR